MAALKGLTTQGRMMATCPQNFTFSTDGKTLYFLAPATKEDTTCTLLKIDYETVTEQVATPVRVLSLQQKGKDARMFSREEELQRERQRVTSLGITSYEYDRSAQQLLFTSAGQLYRYNETSSSADPELVPSSADGSRLCPSFCPVSSDLIAFVRKKDLWVVSMKSGHEYQLTNEHNDAGAEVNTRFAGVPSFVIQEEFDRHVGYWWQPQTDKGTYCILVEMTDERYVDIIRTLDVSANDCECHRYPRPGTPNAAQSVALVEFSLDETHQTFTSVIKYLAINLKILFPWMEYVVRCGWMPDRQSVWVQLLDRNQQRLELIRIPVGCFVSAEEQKSNDTYQMPTVQALLKETSDVWINVSDILYFLNESVSSSDQFSFIWASEATGYRHLQRVTVSNFRLSSDGNQFVETPQIEEKSWLTSGEWEVKETEMWIDEASGLIYFQGTKDTPLEQQLYVVSLSPEGNSMERLTCTGHSHNVTMKEDCSCFVTMHSSLTDFPVVDVFRVQTPAGGSLPTMESCEKICSLNLPKEMGYWPRAPEIFTFKTNDGCTLHGLIFRPATLKEGMKSPVVHYVYCGPHIQLVTNEFLLFRYPLINVLTKLGYVCIAIDGRGSARRGVKFEAHIKNRMGTVEMSDQVEGLQYASSKHDCLDMSRVGILGWSYGGYMALIGLAQHPDVYRVAIAGAPVTHWESYDTGYTERYMGTPQQNPNGYKDGSVLNMVHKFPAESGRLLIVHGLIDENVLFCHTSALVDEFNRALKPYHLQVYPNERHGVRKNTPHYWTTVLSFLEKNLKC